MISTNLNDRAQDILDIAHKQYQIEDCFRIMKTNFCGRPVNHSAERRIKAHFMICYTALLVYRLLECQLDDQKTHITTDNLIDTLKNMNVTIVHDVEYMALYNGSKTLDALETLTSLGMDFKHYRPKDLAKKNKKNFTVGKEFEIKFPRVCPQVIFFYAFFFIASEYPIESK